MRNISQRKNDGSQELRLKSCPSSDQKITLQLDGRVAGQWIELLRRVGVGEGLPLTLDLENICFINCEGPAVIKSLMCRGVRQGNAPLFVAEQLRSARLNKAIDFEGGKAHAT